MFFKFPSASIETGCPEEGLTWVRQQAHVNSYGHFTGEGLTWVRQQAHVNSYGNFTGEGLTRAGDMT